jgi:SAM-dependent methyltransferase
MDVFGLALQDFYAANPQEKLWLNTSYGELEEMPVEVFFRKENEMAELELYALDLCRGSILDIGAGVGSHSIVLQERGLNVNSLEISDLACSIMRSRQVKQVINTDVFSYKTKTFDTLLLLMNGIGISKDLKGLKEFLQHAKELLKPGGQLLFDSSDISYLYENMAFPTHYYGEISYQYQYKGMVGDWFRWLYIDPDTLFKTAKEQGWITQIIYEDENDQYLARLICS